MLSAHKLLLLLYACALLTFACTGSKKKPTVPTPNTRPVPTAQSDVNELRGELNALGKITALQAQAGQGDVSQTELKDLQTSLTEAQEKITELEQAGGGESNDQNKQDIEDLKQRVGELEESKKELESKLAEAGETPSGTEEAEDEETEDEGTGNAAQGTDNDQNTTTTEELTVSVSLTQIQGSESGREAGTYVTFHSDTAVTIETITYGKLESKQIDNKEDSTTTLSMNLPIAMKFTHGSETHCVTAVLDLLDWLNDDTKEKVPMTAKSLDDSEACKP